MTWPNDFRLRMRCPGVSVTFFFARRLLVLMVLAFSFFVSFFVLWHTALDYSINAAELWSVRVI